MKNSTVELMIRNQFNIPPETRVMVEFESSIEDISGKFYNFNVTWYDETSIYRVVTTLPHLNHSVRNLQ